MKKLLLAITILLSTIAINVGVISAASAATTFAADNTGAVCEGIGIAGGGSSDCSDSGGLTVEGVIKNVINILSLVIGVVAVFMIMFAGFKFITANGDANAVSSARNTIIYAIVGLVVAALAQVIVKFVLVKVTTPPKTAYSQSQQVAVNKAFMV